MTILARLDQWKASGVISPEQHAHLAGLTRGEPFSVFLELNILLYAGVLSFVAGLGWTVTTWSEQLGDVVVLAVLSALLVACLWYCFSRAAPWSARETAAPNLAFDYVLYLGCLVWSVELSYIETRFRLLSGQWDLYLLATAALFFAFAYRFDNRLVLSLALSALAGWFGLTLSHWSVGDRAFRSYAILYSLVAAGGGFALHRAGLKPHFLGTYLNLAANVLFCAVVSGVFEREGYGVWLLSLLGTCGASLAWGLERREFSFVAYAAVYGYVGISAVLVRQMHDITPILGYFVITGVAMIAALVQVARNFGRDE